MRRPFPDDYWPVPESLIFCGLLDALLVTVTAPGMVPACAGVKVTSNVQVPCALTVLPQGFLPPGAAENCPLAAIPVKSSVAAWLLVRVIDFAALVLPSAWEAKVSEAGANVTGRTAVADRS